MAVVASGSVVAAVGLTGAGLLSPAESRGPFVRYVAVAVALVAVGALVRLDGPARASARLITVAVAASLLCLATFPASPVAFTLGDDSISPGTPDTEGEGSGGANPRQGDLEGTGGGLNPGVLRLPEGGTVTVEAGDVILEVPDGSQLILGDTTVAAPGGSVTGSVGLVVADGEVRRSDGGAVGPGVGLGGITLERSDGSQVVVGDGALLDVPERAETETAEPDEVDALLAVLLAAFALLAFAPPMVRFSDRLGGTLVEMPEPAPGREAEPEPMAVTMEEGLASVLRSMLADPDPRTAVIGAYARLLAAMAEAGHPRRDQEGPHEHLWRTLGPLGVRHQPVHQLAELFVRARFTPKPIGEEHRQRAIDALADAVADLRLESTTVTDVNADVATKVGAGAAT